MKSSIEPIEGVRTIKEAMELIDFKSIVKAMHILNWQHCFQDVTVDGLKNTIMELYESVEKPNEGTTSCESGGFIVERVAYSDAPDAYIVRFIISQSILVDATSNN